jgi:predicted deacylase
MSFDPRVFGRGGRYRTAIRLSCATLPVLLTRGAQDGATLVMTAGVHGDEFEGVQAIFEVFDELDPARMRGDLIAVPAANPPAFWHGTRISPLDGGNLARVFPGEAGGQPTSEIAWHLGRKIIARADFYLDLHSGGVGWEMPSMVGYDASDERSLRAAMVFGADVVWGHPAIPAGRTVSFAKSHGIPFLYTEAFGAGRIRAEDLAMMKRGIRNLLRHLSILDEPPEVRAPRYHLTGEGDIHLGINAAQRGFFIPSVALLDYVEQGRPLGRLVTEWGETLDEFVAPRAGIIGLLRRFPVVSAGDPLVVIAEVRNP